MNKKYSFKDFTGQLLKQIDPKELNNTEIVGSCFAQEIHPNAKGHLKDIGQLEVDIFPTGMTGVIFRDCNLDNVKIPVGNTVIGGTHKKIKEQNDGEDWILDDLGNPTEPSNKKIYQKLGISIDPKDIPVTKVAQSIIIQAKDYGTIK